MEPVPASLVVGSLVVAGNVSAGKAPTLTNAVGVAGVAVALALIAQVSPKMSSSFAWLIIFGMAIIHLPTIVTKTFGKK